MTPKGAEAQKHIYEHVNALTFDRKIASYTQHTGLLGQLLHEVLQLLMLWKSR
jgi:hypothetical protein